MPVFWVRFSEWAKIANREWRRASRTGWVDYLQGRGITATKLQGKILHVVLNTAKQQTPSGARSGIVSALSLKQTYTEIPICGKISRE